MSRLRGFFLEEASECLAAARAELVRERPERATVYRAVRRLRGSARVAGFAQLADRAAAIERRLRPGQPASGWPPELGSLTASALDELENALAAVRAGKVESNLESKKAMDGESRGEQVGMEELEYRGRAALERAMELRQVLEETIASDQPAGPILDELFDLIRLGMA